MIKYYVCIIINIIFFTSCSSGNNNIIPTENINTKANTTIFPYPKTKYKIELLDSTDINNTPETAETLFWKAIISYRKNRLKEAKKIMEKAKTLAFLYDSSWNGVIDEGLRCIYYDSKDFMKLYYLEKEKGEINPFINFLENMSDKNVYMLKGLTESGAVPLKEYQGDFTLPVTINGQGEEQFIIDTASNLTIISNEIAQKYKIIPMQLGIAGYDTRHLSAIQIKYAKIESLQIGDVTVYNVPVGIVETKSLTWKHLGMFTYFKIDGILGLPVLREFTTTIDYPKKVLTLSMNDVKSEEEAYDIFFVNSFIYVPIEINGTRGYNFCIDSAGEMTELYQNGLEHLKHFYSGEIKIEKTSKEIETIYGRKDIYGVFFPKSFVINNYSLQNTPLLISAYSVPEFACEEHGNLGIDILKKFKVIWDFKNMKMYLSLPND
ncbi:MAG: clan AA aspartic protease [Candidatus Firestonebacteria bacterium]|nr:clan AA aspartic protease [Candidatus Firestonebacteria bacterium]